ncbi:hypothetical protein MRX96_017472, partial [Rhipicephalus microplus]
MCTFISHSAAPVNARAAKAPAVGQADAGSELPRYFLRSHARQLLQGQHLAEKRKLEARESSSGKRRRLESPPRAGQARRGSRGSQSWPASQPGTASWAAVVALVWVSPLQLRVICTGLS